MSHIQPLISLNQVDSSTTCGDWSDVGGPWWNLCWKCNTSELTTKCLYSCVCWCFCGPCVKTKLLAWTFDQPCTGDYYLLAIFLSITCPLSALCQLPCLSFSIPIVNADVCVDTYLRRRLRKKFNLKIENTCTDYTCDFLTSWCCTCCSNNQMRRSVPIEAWDWTV